MFAPRLRLAALAFGLLTAGLPAAPQAHHGWGGYDSTNVLTLTGTIRESNFENPHGLLRLEVPGKVWRVVLSPPLRMQNRGLASERLKPGATVTVVGYPHKSDAEEMRAERIIVQGQTTELR